MDAFGTNSGKMSRCCCVVVANVVKPLLFQLLRNGIGLVGNGLKLPPEVINTEFIASLSSSPYVS
jgi:hypothetical protein